MKDPQTKSVVEVAKLKGSFFFDLLKFPCNMRMLLSHCGGPTVKKKEATLELGILHKYLCCLGVI